MKVEYDELSFWAGVSVGANLHGKSAFGVMPGWNPDGDLILRPITQGVGRIYFEEAVLVARAVVDTVNEDTVFPENVIENIVQEIGRVYFGVADIFDIRAINERLVLDETIKAFSVDEDINPLDYDDTIVFINSSGAFTMDEMTRTFTSAAQPVDIGTMQEVTVKVDEFAEVSTQEVIGVFRLSHLYFRTLYAGARESVADCVQPCTTVYELHGSGAQVTVK